MRSRCSPGFIGPATRPTRRNRCSSDRVQKIPGTVDLRLVLAQIYLQEGRPADAEAQLLKLVALQPAEKAHRLRLAQFYAQQNQVDAAETVPPPGHQGSARRARSQAVAGQFPRRAAQPRGRGAGAARHDRRGARGLSSSSSRSRASTRTARTPAKAEAVYQGVIDKESLAPPGLDRPRPAGGLRLQENDVDRRARARRRGAREEPARRRCAC